MMDKQKLIYETGFGASEEEADSGTVSGKYLSSHLRKLTKVYQLGLWAMPRNHRGLD